MTEAEHKQAERVRTERIKIWRCPDCGHAEDLWLWDEADATEKGPPACPIDGCYETAMYLLEVVPVPSQPLAEQPQRCPTCGSDDAELCGCGTDPAGIPGGEIRDGLHRHFGVEFGSCPDLFHQEPSTNA